MRLTTIIKFKEELTDIINSGLSIEDYCKLNKKNLSDINNKVYNTIEARNKYSLEVATVLRLYSQVTDTTDLQKFYLELADNIEAKSQEGRLCFSENIVEETGTPDEFDGTTNVTYNRGSESNKILSYDIQVKVRDKVDFITNLSRSDAETIFGMYTYYGGNITARNVANEFPKYTLPEIKKIFRAFGLTKDSPWFPPHLGEECSEEQLATYRMNLKERAAFKYADSRQERDFKNVINKMASEINQLSNFKSQFEETLNKAITYNVEVAKHLPNIYETDGDTLMLFLSDMHIGAKVNSQAIFNNHYDKDVIKQRLDEIIKYLIKSTPYSKVVVVNVGDALDGMDGQTARRDHYIPQNMNNFEQIDTYVWAINYLFENMIYNNVAADYSYISVPCGNHDGAFGYAAAQLAASTLSIKYPEIETEVESKFYLRYDVENFSYLICHGKDEQFMKSGFKINLDDNTELKINQYIESLNGLMPNINVVSGDLHNESMSRGKKFKYYKVGSFFGSSEYCMYGWGNTPAHVNFHVISNNKLLTGTIEL